MGLWINDSGASTVEIKAGIAAAESVFDTYKVVPEEALGTPLWSAAENAAFVAAFAEWQRWPEAACLVWE